MQSVISLQCSTDIKSICLLLLCSLKEISVSTVTSKLLYLFPQPQAEKNYIPITERKNENLRVFCKLF